MPIKYAAKGATPNRFSHYLVLAAVSEIRHGRIDGTDLRSASNEALGRIDCYLASRYQLLKRIAQARYRSIARQRYRLDGPGSRFAPYCTGLETDEDRSRFEVRSMAALCDTTHKLSARELAHNDAAMDRSGHLLPKRLLQTKQLHYPALRKI